MDTSFAEVVNRVISHYPLKVEKVYLLTNKGKKAVWSIETNIGEVIIKKVPFDENHIELMIHAINYLRDNLFRFRFCFGGNGVYHFLSVLISDFDF